MFSRRDDGADFEPDFIKRAIKKLGEALAKILLDAQVQQAPARGIEALRGLARERLRVDYSLLEMVDAASAVSILRAPERILQYAHIIEAEAQLRALEGDERAVVRLRQRAADVTRIGGVTPDR